jgi:hypothetical protein
MEPVRIGLVTVESAVHWLLMHRPSPQEESNPEKTKMMIKSLKFIIKLYLRITLFDRYPLE